MDLIIYKAQRYEKLIKCFKKKKVLIKTGIQKSHKNEHKNPANPLRYFSAM